MPLKSLNMSQIGNIIGDHQNKEIIADLINESHVQQNSTFKEFLKNEYFHDGEKQDSFGPWEPVNLQSQKSITLALNPMNFFNNEENDSFIIKPSDNLSPQYRFNKNKSYIPSKHVKSRSLLVIPGTKESKF